MIDLHMHSTFSDGSLTPPQLVEKALGIGLTAAGLTDHDTTAGNASFLDACRGTPLRGVPGVEISADVKTGTMHLLGYFLEPANAALEEALTRIRRAREERNARILQKLNTLGFAITMPEVESYAGEDVVGRPHFAQALLAKGYVKDTREAFERYLAKGKAAYSDRFRLPPDQGIALIRGARGVAVLAHPSTLELAPSALKQFVGELRDMGLQGIEVYYSEHSPELQRRYLRLANETGLVATGGSDFHGAANPDIKMGAGFGSLTVPDAIVDEISKRRQS